MKLILIGVAVIDIIDYVDTYPIEDDKIRSNKRISRVGGNACNSSCILKELLNDFNGFVYFDDSDKSKDNTELFSGLDQSDKVSVSVIYPSLQSLTKDRNLIKNGCEHDYVLNELEKAGVNPIPVMMTERKDNTVISDELYFPISFVIVSKKNSSRTIIHSRNMPEITSNDFIDSLTKIESMKENVDNSEPYWFHFEGRNIDPTIQMLMYINEIWSKKQNSDYIISVEIEKNRSPSQDELKLIPFANVIIVGKDYLSKMNYLGHDDFLTKISQKSETKPKQDAVFFFPNGSQGSAAINLSSGTHQKVNRPAVKFAKNDIVELDTVGAGDAFNAGIIYAMGCKKVRNLCDILNIANRVAFSAIYKQSMKNIATSKL